MGRPKPWHILLALQLIGLSASTGPPRLTGPASQLVTARVGTMIKLPCPVESNPDAIMEWYKDKDLIHQGWERFRVTDKFLRIKEILIEDAGHYTCKAINGFGNISINITLRVVDGTMSVRKHNSFPQIPDDELPKSVAKPAFEFLDRMRRRSKIDRPVGSTVRFNCKAVGHPRPQIYWFKNGQPLTPEELGLTKPHRWTLKLRLLKKENRGKYRCDVINSQGSVNFTYTLEVIEKMKKKPEILPPHPMNITVDYGSSASFHCRVKSVVQPHIQWLKRIDDHSKFVNKNATIVVDDHRYIVLDTGSVLHTTDGIYLNKLVIPRATDADAGMYICMGANSMGFSYREAFLFVASDRSNPYTSRPSRNSSSGSSLTLVIAVPSVLVFLLIGGFIYLIQQRRQCCCCTSRSPGIQRFPVPTHDKDSYPAVHNPHMYPISHNNSRDKFSKPHSAVDYYTDISSASRSHPSHHQHQHAHYNY